MNIKTETRMEQKLLITETDIVNGGEVLVLTAYAVKENEVIQLLKFSIRNFIVKIKKFIT